MNVLLAKIPGVPASSPRPTARQVHQLFFDRLYPKAPAHLRKQALEQYDSYFFIRRDGTIGCAKGLPPSLAYLVPKLGLLVTDERRLAELNLAEGEAIPVMTLESRSHRARFCLTSDGQVVEFKGLTPSDYDLAKRNPNSDQPEGLLALVAGITEVMGLKLIGAIACDLIPLEPRFHDLKDYAQLVRAGRPGQRYLPWLRMDMGIEMYQLLADLDGISLEQFLYQSGQRFGQQLKTLHDNYLTLHNPFRHGTAPSEPFFSSLHSGNVTPDGTIIDLEGLQQMTVVEGPFWRNAARLSDKLQTVALEQGLGVISRASDLHRFLGGGHSVNESCLFQNVVVQGKNPTAFICFLAGFAKGYFGKEIDHVMLRSTKELGFGDTLGLYQQLAAS